MDLRSKWEDEDLMIDELSMNKPVHLPYSKTETAQEYFLHLKVSYK